MGTHYQDQPPEHWAGDVSLDPTPVWKQYILVAVLVLLALVLIGVVSLAALMPQLATPPAVVPGGRVVLARSDLPAVGEMPRLVGPPLVGEADAFWLAQPVAGDVVAVRARWTSTPGAPQCRVMPLPPFTNPIWSFTGTCEAGAGVEGAPVWGPRGEPIAAPRALDRYLVSVDRDRVIVNVSREIRGYGATPQPRVPPLGSP